MRFYAGEALSALALYLFLYVVLVILLVSFGSVALWSLIWIVGVGGTVGLSLAVAAQGQDVNRPGTYFAIAVAGLLILGCLTLSPVAEAETGSYAMVAGAGALGVPLGLGAVRLWLGPWRSPRPGSILVGAVAGAFSVLICLPIFAFSADRGLPVFVGLSTIPVVDLFGFDVFPWAQSSTVVRKTLSAESLGVSRLPGVLFFVALLFQGVQSLLAAVWDTLILGAAALLVGGVATRLVPQRS